MAVVHVPPGEATEVAQKLLAAADQLGLAASVVATSSDGIFGFSFVVPDEVHATAFETMVATEDPIELELESQPAPKKRGRPRKPVLAEPEEQQ